MAKEVTVTLRLSVARKGKWGPEDAEAGADSRIMLNQRLLLRAVGESSGGGVVCEDREEDGFGLRVDKCEALGADERLREAKVLLVLLETGWACSVEVQSHARHTLPRLSDAYSRCHKRMRYGGPLALARETVTAQLDERGNSTQRGAVGLIVSHWWDLGSIYGPHFVLYMYYSRQDSTCTVGRPLHLQCSVLR